MTNLKTIKRSIGRMVELEKMETDGRMAEFVKQEQAMLRRELNRLHIRLNGIRDLATKPDAIFIVDIKREHNALSEARRLRVPVVAIVDTNTDPTLVDYPIAGNDDAIRSIKAVLSAVTQPMVEARAAYEAASAKMKAEADAKANKSDSAPDLPIAETPIESASAEKNATEPASVESDEAKNREPSSEEIPEAPAKPVES